MTHHGFLVQRRLPIEDDEVAINNVAFNLPTILQGNVTSSLVEAKIDSFSVVTNDISSARMFIGPIPHELMQLLNVVRSDRLWICESPGDSSRYTNLVKGKIRVTSNDGTRGEINTL